MAFILTLIESGKISEPSVIDALTHPQSKADEFSNIRNKVQRKDPEFNDLLYMNAIEFVSTAHYLYFHKVVTALIPELRRSKVPDGLLVMMEGGKIGFDFQKPLFQEGEYSDDRSSDSGSDNEEMLTLAPLNEDDDTQVSRTKLSWADQYDEDNDENGISIVRPIIPPPQDSNQPTQFNPFQVHTMVPSPNPTGNPVQDPTPSTSGNQDSIPSSSGNQDPIPSTSGNQDPIPSTSGNQSQGNSTMYQPLPRRDIHFNPGQTYTIGDGQHTLVIPVQPRHPPGYIDQSPTPNLGAETMKSKITRTTPIVQVMKHRVSSFSRGYIFVFIELYPNQKQIPISELIELNIGLVRKYSVLLMVYNNISPIYFDEVPPTLLTTDALKTYSEFGLEPYIMKNYQNIKERSMLFYLLAFPMFIDFCLGGESNAGMYEFVTQGKRTPFDALTGVDLTENMPDESYCSLIRYLHAGGEEPEVISNFVQGTEDLGFTPMVTNTEFCTSNMYVIKSMTDLVKVSHMIKGSEIIDLFMYSRPHMIFISKVTPAIDWIISKWKHNYSIVYL